MTSNCRDPDGRPLSKPYSGQDPVVESRMFPAWSPKDRDFDVITSPVVSIGPGATWTIVAQYLIPDGTEGVWLWWGCDTYPNEAFQAIRWRLRVGGEVRLLFPSITPLAGMTQDVLRRVHIFGKGGQSFVLEAQHDTALTEYEVIGCVKGLIRPASYTRD